MSDDRLKDYKKAVEQIEVPKELKEKTIAKMKAQKKVKRVTPLPYAAAAALAVVVLGGAYLYQGQDGTSEITLAQSLDADSIVEEVALSEGSLTFQKMQGEFSSMGLNLGVMEGEKVAVDEETYFEYLGSNPLPKSVPDGMTKQENEAQELIKDDAGNYISDYFMVTYAEGEDRTLELVMSKQEIPNEEECEELNEGKVGETSVRIAYYGKEEDAVFTAYFKVNGIGYKVKGKGITQEEFVQSILEIIKN